MGEKRKMLFNQELFNLLKENPLTGLCFFQEKIIDANTTFQEITGCSKKELLKISPLLLLKAEDQYLYQDFFSLEILEKKEQSLPLIAELPIMCHLKETKWVLAHSSFFLLDNKPTGALFILDITMQKFLQSQVEKLAITDPLTGTHNRIALEDKVKEEVLLSLKKQKPLSLIFFEIDNFKNVNDQFGHEAGDRTLIELARIVQKNIRTIDFFARYGGAEFAILTPGADVLDAIRIAERIRLEVETTHIDIVGKNTITCGISQLKNFELDTPPLQFVRMAIEALLKAREQGRNRVLAW